MFDELVRKLVAEERVKLVVVNLRVVAQSAVQYCRIDAPLLSEKETLNEYEEHRLADLVVNEFDELCIAYIAEVVDGVRKCHENVLVSADSVNVATNHHRQFAPFGPHSPAGDWTVMIVYRFLGRPIAEFYSRRWRKYARVEDDGTGVGSGCNGGDHVPARVRYGKREKDEIRPSSDAAVVCSDINASV